MEPLALNLQDAAEALGVAPDFFREHIKPDLRIVYVGRKQLVSVTELRRWLDEHQTR